MVDEVDARACLAAAQGSETLNAWCRANGVSAGCLHAWRRKLSKRWKREDVRLVELSVPRRVAARYEVVLGEVRVVVGDDFQDETLSRLLRVVAAC